MNPSDAAYTVALLIGTGVVSWCVNSVVNMRERITRLEASVDKCSCGKDMRDRSV